MSADLSKSKLASKDKDELTQIAQAMGGKPPSRARKADLIDLIIELAQGGPEPASAPAPSAPVYSADPMADVRAAEGKAPTPSPRQRRDAEPAPDQDGDDGEPSGGQRSGRGRSRGGDTAGGRSDGNANTNTKPNGNANGDGNANGNGNGNRATGSSNDADDAGNGSDDADNGADGGDHPEPGNRRRRRRGRNRERADQNEDFAGDPVSVAGVLDLRDDGYGFLRVNGYLPTRDDVYVSVKQVRDHGLRKGDHLTGTGRPANRSEKNPAMLTIDSVNGNEPDDGADRPVFDELTPVLPTERLLLEREDDPDNHTARIIDLLAPIGKGQRAMVVAPPATGRTTVLKDIARSIETNHADVKLVVLLVAERPEEVTEVRRLMVDADVVTSTFEQPAEEHGAIAELTLERAKRLVELGQDVVVIVDGLTRLVRANNVAIAGNGQIHADGITASALYPVKRFFGAARKVQEGGSLTVIASAQIESGSPIDALIVDEFSGTANMELRLDHDAAARRLYPAVDVAHSGTRNEEQLFDEDELAQVAGLRRLLAAAADEGGPAAGLEQLLSRLSSTDTNADLLKGIAKG